MNHALPTCMPTEQVVRDIGQFNEAQVEEALCPGALIADRYRISRRLGEGGMATVYLAEHILVGRLVALKVLAAQWLGHPRIPRRFRDEARAASAATHPNIVGIFDVGELPDGRPFLVMEYIEGRELFEIIRDQESLKPHHAAPIVRDVARALDAAHCQGVIHRDLKSANVIVLSRADTHVVKVLDFGIAAILGTDRPATMAGYVVGTPKYMAPEQARGEPVTTAVDIYALGVLLYESLTGTFPFTELGAEGVLIAKLNGPAPSIAQVKPDLPSVLIELVDQCLAMDPPARPARAAEVAERLERFMQRSDPRVDDPRVGAPSVGWRRIIGSGLACLCVVVGVVLLVLLMRRVSDDAALPPHGHAALISAPDEHREPSAVDSPPPPPAREEAEPVMVAALVEPRPPPVEPTARRAFARDGCERIRRQARQARQIHDWTGVLKYTRDLRCWDRRGPERLKLQVKAHMELGEWANCMKVGQRIGDEQTRQWVTLCQRREESL